MVAICKIWSALFIFPSIITYPAAYTIAAVFQCFVGSDFPMLSAIFMYAMNLFDEIGI